MISRNNKLLQLLLIFVLQSIVDIGQSQTLTISVKATLPSILTESSGLEVINRNSFWSHNDSGGNAELYNFDSTGTLLRTLKILNASNIDWEDLAKDSIGNFYIGDFGNNLHNRQDLKIYKIPSPSSIIGDSVVPQVINYSYSNQFAFPPADSLKSFDMEAMIAYHDSLYLFSKDWSNPYSGYTKLYKLPYYAGTFIAELIDSFYTGPGPPIAFSITAADISPDNSKLILLGYNKCWLFSNFVGHNFFSGTVEVLNFPSLTQKEGVCFISNDELYITDEYAYGTGQKLYDLNLQQIAPVTANEIEENNFEFKIFPSPFSCNTTISLSSKEEEYCTLILYNQLGHSIPLPFGTIFLNPKTVQTFFLDETIFKNYSGIFILEVTRKNKQVLRKKIVKLM